MSKRKMILALGLTLTLTALAGCGEGLDTDAKKTKFSQMEGLPANLRNIAGEWQSDCLPNDADGSGIGSTIKNIRFEGSNFMERTSQFSDAHCSKFKVAANETANGSFSLIPTGSRIKFSYSYRAITLMSDNQVSIYNANSTCSIDNWRKDLGRDVSLADCTNALNNMEPATISVFEDNGVFTDIRLKSCMMTPRGVVYCEALELARVDGTIPTLE